MLPLQFSAAPKLFPSFDDYCTIYCSSICSGILLLLLLQLASQLAFGSTTILLRRPNYREFRKLLLQLHSYIPSLSLSLLLLPLYDYYFDGKEGFHTSMAFTSPIIVVVAEQSHKRGCYNLVLLKWLVACAKSATSNSNQTASCSVFTLHYFQHILYTLLHALLIADVIVICGLLKLSAVW